MIHSFRKASDCDESRQLFFWFATQRTSPDEGTESQRGQRRRVLPNVLPLPRKSSAKQDEPRAISMGYVVEIEGTT
jgi:hypothetical protein